MTNQLGPMLAAPGPPAASQLVAAAWRVVEPLVSLEAHEQEYIAGIHRGEANVALLFPQDPEEAERIAGHPAIQWKLRNVRERLGNLL